MDRRGRSDNNARWSSRQNSLAPPVHPPPATRERSSSNEDGYESGEIDPNCPPPPPIATRRSTPNNNPRSANPYHREINNREDDRFDRRPPRETSRDLPHGRPSFESREIEPPFASRPLPPFGRRHPEPVERAPPTRPPFRDPQRPPLTRDFSRREADLDGPREARRSAREDQRFPHTDDRYLKRTYEEANLRPGRDGDDKRFRGDALPRGSAASPAIPGRRPTHFEPSRRPSSPAPPPFESNARSFEQGRRGISPPPRFESSRRPPSPPRQFEPSHRSISPRPPFDSSRRPPSPRPLSEPRRPPSPPPIMSHRSRRPPSPPPPLSASGRGRRPLSPPMYESGRPPVNLPNNDVVRRPPSPSRFGRPQDLPQRHRPSSPVGRYSGPSDLPSGHRPASPGGMYGRPSEPPPGPRPPSPDRYGRSHDPPRLRPPSPSRFGRSGEPTSGGPRPSSPPPRFGRKIEPSLPPAARPPSPPRFERRFDHPPPGPRPPSPGPGPYARSGEHRAPSPPVADRFGSRSTERPHDRRFDQRGDVGPGRPPFGPSRSDGPGPSTPSFPPTENRDRAPPRAPFHHPPPPPPGPNIERNEPDRRALPREIDNRPPRVTHRFDGPAPSRFSDHQEPDFRRPPGPPIEQGPSHRVPPPPPPFPLPTEDRPRPFDNSHGPPRDRNFVSRPGQGPLEKPMRTPAFDERDRDPHRPPFGERSMHRETRPQSPVWRQNNRRMPPEPPLPLEAGRSFRSPEPSTRFHADGPNDIGNDGAGPRNNPLPRRNFGPSGTPKPSMPRSSSVPPFGRQPSDNSTPSQAIAEGRKDFSTTEKATFVPATAASRRKEDVDKKPASVAAKGPPPPPPRPPSPPPPVGEPSGIVNALTRLADLESQFQYAYAKHMQLIERHKYINYQIEVLKDLPVGIDALKDDLEELAKSM